MKSESTDHERIFLAPLDEPEDPYQGRMWCEDDGNWDSPGVEFIRLDLHQSALAAAEARGRVKGLEQAAKIAEYGIARANRDWNDRKKAEGASKMVSEILEAIRAAREGK